MKKFSKPKVSVVTSTWNREKHLRKLAKSLINQNFKKFEWIIGNDGSTDNTDKFIKKLSKDVNFKIKYISSDLRIGKAKMENILYDEIEGDYVLASDSDDFYLNDSLNYLFKLIEKYKRKKNFTAVLAQNINELGQSQTFYKNSIPKENYFVKWNDLMQKIKGDGTILVKSKVFKGQKFPEVDFVINESSLLQKVYNNKIFLVSNKIVKIMDRSAENSVSFGKKMSYCRGSAYCISKLETLSIFNKKKIKERIIIILNYWRYTLHGDIPFGKGLNMMKPIKKNILYCLIYPFSLILAFRDVLLNKVDKTHKEFEKNKRIAKILKLRLN